MKLSIAIATTLAVAANLAGASDTGLRQRKLPTTTSISCTAFDLNEEQCSSDSGDDALYCAIYVNVNKNVKKLGQCSLKCLRKDEVDAGKGNDKFTLATYDSSDITGDSKDDLCDQLCLCVNNRDDGENEEVEYLEVEALCGPCPVPL